MSRRYYPSRGVGFETSNASLNFRRTIKLAKHYLEVEDSSCLHQSASCFVFIDNAQCWIIMSAPRSLWVLAACVCMEIYPGGTLQVTPCSRRRRRNTPQTATILLSSTLLLTPARRTA